jgi:hypothetical protein
LQLLGDAEAGSGDHQAYPVSHPRQDPPMDSTLFLSFLLVSIGLIIIPGPNVLVIISTSITHGRVRGLQMVAGTSLAMAL